MVDRRQRTEHVDTSQKNIKGGGVPPYMKFTSGSAHA